MTDPFLGEIQIIGFNFAPRGWALCDGQILPISQNQSLYSLLGTTYGGDGRTSFALPDLRSRTPLHRGIGYNLGQKGGAETVTLTSDQVPAHSHTAKAQNVAADTSTPGGNMAAETTVAIYGAPSDPNLVSMHNGTIANAGGGQGHNNMQPYQTLNFIIALRGIFPPRN